MVRWLRWHCPPDTGFAIRALAVWGRARYLSVTEAPHNTDFHTWMGKKHFCFFQTAETGSRTSNSDVKGSGANHYPRAPALTAGKFTTDKFMVHSSRYAEVLTAISSFTFSFAPQCWCFYKSFTFTRKVLFKATESCQNYIFYFGSMICQHVHRPELL